MKSCIFLSILYILGISLFEVNAHSYFSAITIDGVVHTEGDCMRPHPSSKYDYPISSLDNPNGLTSADMTCGFLPAASRAANKKCAVNPGSVITLQWHYEMGMGDSDTFIIDPSHKGPCIVYMAKSETGSGNVWFKIFEDGYDTTTKKWCVDKLRANKGKFTVTIPTDIAPGNYLFRGELIALHEGFDVGGAQPYVGCAELTVGGSGTVNPSGVAIPGAYTATDPGIYFDIYTSRNPPYPIPGPKLYVSGSGTGNTAITTGKPPVTTGKPPVSTGKPPVTTGKPPVTTGKLPVTTGKPPITTGKTAVTTGNPPVTTGKLPVTTGKAPVTTGKASVTPVTTGKPSVTTGNSKVTTGSTDTTMCYLPGTPNINGKINSDPPTCGKNSKRARCADGQCCSKYGYCGPIMESDGKYYEELNGIYQVVTAEVAFGLYCNNNTGDYRKVPCSTIQSLNSENNLENDHISGSSSMQLNIWVYIAFAFVLLGITL